jgi:hypothetical protein
LAAISQQYPSHAVASAARHVAQRSPFVAKNTEKPPSPQRLDYPGARWLRQGEMSRDWYRLSAELLLRRNNQVNLC